MPGSDSLLTNASKLRLPALTRAKNALASSFDNLRSKPDQERRSRFFKTLSKPTTNAEKLEDKSFSQSLDMKPPSPTSSEKAALDTLMDPIPTTAPKLEVKEDTMRKRTWSGFTFKSRSATKVSVDSESKDQEPVPEPKDKDLSSVDVSPREANQSEHSVKFTTMLKQEDENMDHRTSPSLPMSRTPLTPVRKIKSNRPRDRYKLHRLSFTPPAAPTFKSDFRRTHRRATSYGFTTPSWRQEIFESVSTPTKPSGHKQSRSIGSNFCEFITGNLL